MKQQHPSVLTVAAVSAIAVAFAGLLEIGAAVCASAALFAGYGLFWSLILLPFLVLRPSVVKFTLYGVLLLSLVILYVVPWSSRKVFLRDLANVHTGMTRPEVEAVMGAYMKGTGWPAVPEATSSTGQLTDVSSGITLTTRTAPSGELEIQDAITYRHSDDGAFNSDWGVVRFENGRVVGKAFMPD